MPTVCDILRKFEWRLNDIDKRLAAIEVWDASGRGRFQGELWEVSDQQIAVWDADTTRPLSWNQGTWARLRAGKIEARGGIDLRTSGSGARLEIDASAIKVYDATSTLQVQIGDLAGASDPKFGDLSGWGLYAYSRAYLNEVYLWTIHLWGGGAIYGDSWDYLCYSPPNDEWLFLIGGIQRMVIGATLTKVFNDFEWGGNLKGKIDGGQF